MGWRPGIGAVICFLLGGCYDSTPFPVASDAAADTRVETPADVRPDTRPDTVPDTFRDPVPDTAPDGPACPPDDPLHIYINVTGSVEIVGHWPSYGETVRALSVLDALISPDPELLAESAVEVDGSFSLECVDVKEVALGLVILVDDRGLDGMDGFYFPTGTTVAFWGSDDDKVDVEDAVAYALPNLILEDLAALAPIDAEREGLIMGLVLDASTRLPIDGAVVVDPHGFSLPIVYPAEGYMALDDDWNTSGNGSFLYLGSSILRSFSARAGRYTFYEVQGATKAGLCYFIVLEGE